jgi:hypothetical protein
MGGSSDKLQTPPIQITYCPALVWFLALISYNVYKDLKFYDQTTHLLHVLWAKVSIAHLDTACVALLGFRAVNIIRRKNARRSK